jgi:aryl-alcohol dehydrogenase-like predicted oxidoreductase
MSAPCDAMERTIVADLERAVSRVGLGTASLASGDRAEAVRTIRAAVDQGVDLVDTAPAYGLGRAEEIVGEALAHGALRDRVVLVTKAGLSWSESGSVRRDATAERIEADVDASLRRLRTDRIDVELVHWPDPFEPFEDTARVLERLRQGGKIRAIGVYGYAPAEMLRFGRVARITAAEQPLNVFERDAERDVLPYCRARGVATLACSPLCRGLLSARAPDRDHVADPKGDDAKRAPPRRTQYAAAVRALDDFARERFGRRVEHLALRWVLDRGASIALLGARTPRDLDAASGAMGFSLGEDAMRRVAAIVEEHVVDPVGPPYAAPPTRPLA